MLWLSVAGRYCLNMILLPRSPLYVCAALRVVPYRVVAVAAGLLPEALAKEAHCTSSTAASSSTSATAGQCSASSSSSSGNGSGTPVLITYGDRDELITRDRVDR
jgi:hypothetical protein